MPITYASNAASYATAQLSHVIPLLAEQFPLRNVHWRPSSFVQSLKPVMKQSDDGPSTVPAIRTIQSMPINLMPLALHAPNDTNVPIFERLPCVHLFFVACDDSDVYRAQVRNEIRHWLAEIRQHCPNDYDYAHVPMDDERDSVGPLPPEHLIVLLPPTSGGVFTSSSSGGGSKGPMGRFYTLNKGTVLEKLRADFNSNTKEHVVALPKLPANKKDNDPALWIELIARIKECTATSIGRLIDAQDRVVNMHESTKKGVHWTLGGSIVRMEQVIQTLEGLDLLPDALHVYETIEKNVAFAIANGRARLPPGGTEPGDDSLHLLGTLRKPYVSLLEKNKLSLFDIHCYLYARKSMLLAAMGHIVLVMQQTPAFVARVTQILRPHRHFLAKGFLEAWSFSVALDAVEQCQTWLVEWYGDAADARTTHAFHAAKAELLELAVRQLVRIGVQMDMLPHTAPFDYIESGTVSLFSPDAHLTRQELVDAMSSEHAFDSQLRGMVHRTLLAASLCEQVPRTLRLRYLLATLYMTREMYESAHEVWVELLAHPALVHSPLMYGAAHAKYLVCLEKQGQAHGDMWVKVLTNAVQALCTLRATPSVGAADLDEMKLLSMLADAAEANDTDATLLGYNGMHVHLKSTRAVRDGDRTFVDVDVVSRLPAVLSVDSVHIWLANYRQKQLQFRAGKCTLAPGTNQLRLECSTGAVGYFHLQATQIQYHRVQLESIAQSAASLSTLWEAQQQEYMRHRVCIPADGDALHMDLFTPREIQLHAQRHVLLRVETGRDALDQASFTITPQSDLELAHDDAPKMFCDSNQAQVSRAPTGNLVLHSVPAHTSCTIVLPVSQVSRSALVQVHVSCQYCSGTRHSSMHCTLQTSLALPFSINIQDYFRLNTLLSKLSLEATAGTHIRLCTPNVESAPEESVSVQVPSSGPPVKLGPHETSTYLLQFSHPSDVRRTSEKPFTLTLAYRTAADEAQAKALYVLTKLLRNEPAWAKGDQALLERALCACLAKSTYAPVVLDKLFWQHTFQRWGWPQESERTRQVQELVESVFAELGRGLDVFDLPKPQFENDAQERAWAACEASLAWRTLVLPLDVPFVDAVNAVSIRPPPMSHIALGEPIDVAIDVTISFAWSQHVSGDAPLLLQYNILSDYEHWLVWGTKKGMWTINDTLQHSHHTIHATLVPVRPGWLLYPRLRITPVGPASRPFRCETYMKNAGHGIHVVTPSQPNTYWVDVRPTEPTSA